MTGSEMPTRDQKILDEMIFRRATQTTLCDNAHDTNEFV